MAYELCLLLIRDIPNVTAQWDPSPPAPLPPWRRKRINGRLQIESLKGSHALRGGPVSTSATCSGAG